MEEVIDKLKQGKGAGLDEVPNFVIKTAKHVIKQPLMEIINQAIREGVYPKPWKSSLILPLHKKKSKLEAKNHRPITILNKLSLCLESVILKQMNEHWKRLSLISETQHGYIETRSCTSALASMYDEWTRQADKNMFVGIFLLDQSSAFEIVDPFLLDKKLEALRTKENARKLILNYLLERPQITKIDNFKSEEIIKDIGVPAGSKLGPLLYSVYTTDLPKTTEGTLTSYADDSTNSVADKTALGVKVKLESDAEKIRQYMRASRLLIAEDKSVFILASNKQKIRTEDDKKLTLKIGDQEIAQSRCAKILGVLVNSQLDWTSHLHGIPGDEEEVGLLKKLSNRIGLAHKVKNLPFKLRKMVITGTFLSKLSYGLEVWGSATKGQLNQVGQLEKMAARMVTKNHRSVSSAENFKQCGWLNIENLIKLKTLTFFYKLRMSQTVPYFEKLIGRGRKEFSSRFPEYEQEQGRSVKYGTVSRFKRLWNDLPEEVRTAPAKQFKKVARSYIEANDDVGNV